jgi:hypothetical protein
MATSCAVIPKPEEGEGSRRPRMTTQATLCDPATIGGIPRLRSDDKRAVVNGWKSVKLRPRLSMLSETRWSLRHAFVVAKRPTAIHAAALLLNALDCRLLGRGFLYRHLAHTTFALNCERDDENGC